MYKASIILYSKKAKKRYNVPVWVKTEISLFQKNAVNEYFEHKVQKSIEIDSIVTIHYLEFHDGYEDAVEEHGFWELVFVDRGECTVQADDACFTLRQGQLTVHAPYEKHMIRPVKGMPSNVFIISFYCHSPAMRSFKGQVLEATMTVRQHIAAIIYEASLTFDLSRNDPSMKGLIPKKDDPLWGGEQTILIRLEMMLIELVRRNKEQLIRRKRFFAKDIIDDELTLKVVAFMEERLYAKFSMDELSKALSFSKSHISRHFLKTSGTTIVDYFHTLKIHEAKRLIRSSRKNFFEISELLMFSNPHYFSTVFKKCTGMTPTQYKRSCMKE